MSKTKGRVTLPSESHFLKETREMLDRWGADALRDSDGTKLDDEIKSLDAKIYTTYFVARGHNEFAEKHMDECQQMLLMSKHNLALDTTVTIDFLDGYFREQVQADYVHDPKKWWEVIDRTTQEIVPLDSWSVDTDRHLVTVTDAVPFHEYTVSFFVYAIWDPTQMYNHITNNWGDKPHDIPFDVRQPASGAFARDYLKKWLADNPDTDVVRFTTFFYHFTLVFNADAKEKFVDWFGYGATVSIRALEEFEQEYGYALRPEDIVDNGYYNTTFRVPTKAYRDYMEFIQKFVARKAKELVDLVHDAGREAMMFLGDNWIGTEPYGPYFESIGLDAVVGSVGGGATLRLISDIPGVKYTEGRFLPYFFPDTFYEGNDPCVEAIDNWLSARRALMRNPVDRIGYGGYLSLAYKFPKFVDYIEKVTDEFRLIYDNVKGKKPYCGLKVAILNSWGGLRSWQSYMVAHALWYKQTYSYFGILESLSGAAVDVVFMSFDDIRNNGIPKDIDVIINAGDAGTAFSGGEEWLDEKLITTVRRWIHEGGGFVGVGDPSAVHRGGRFFQLADVLGVDKELGFTLSTDKYFKDALDTHFITEDRTGCFDFGESRHDIYALSASTEIIEYSDNEVHLAANAYGSGRGVYIAGLPYSYENTRLLMRVLYFAAHKEESFLRWYADNVNCEVNAYPESGKYAILNNSNEEQTTNFYDGEGTCEKLTLRPCEILWR
ncbi:1,3-beta-galactosyl-N-acetylhexosamine phosphorylase [[Clostridium] hylemonae]|uniref:1,3-beta-galactosyl-N-acetylhexosamine phosphorylase n=1 Tax=[Clostridium] hylemonae DSM 15053 TaxID=553973 RepID=C0C5M2_9FIRM|nr:1,3-beta-galactosyl-N-acetylhexosamine phosphorylase [[Clostridium] hylemonae]EEG72406.1 1,3-beta-galactosyl-N-acetylhexosamine phosphorylase [[Clostridium] hylemonae DSM 15053]QEK16584.1 1,3-beta-galactosyl-N-acetylhexosamine phosphorylase [[Clostridium] hylemonae DSM 15053]